MTSSRDITCIVCPVGCVISVSGDDGGGLVCDGHECARGAEYAQQEYRDPRRIVTTTMAVIGGRLPLVSVKTLQPVPRDEMAALVQALRARPVRAPVRRGAVVAENVGGVVAVATRSVPAG